MNNAKIGAALLGGYLLGRTKKGKLAIGMGAMLAGSRVNPVQVGKTLQESPLVNTLAEQVRTELGGAGKAAATTVLTAKADSLADALHARTSGLRQQAERAEDEDADEEEGTAETEASDEEEEPDTDEEPDADEEEKPRAKARQASGRAPKTGQAAKKTSSSARSRTKSAGSRARRPDDG
ncbi:hypothetical protein [Streptomyces sp. NPDC126514]|uniref:hypothetical protein n=1 Tax=Streptomyces sp. NPDC126514 TaxID=3155210 RepID=UPI00331BB733